MLSVTIYFLRSYLVGLTAYLFCLCLVLRLYFVFVSREGIDETGWSKVFAACMCDTSYRCRIFNFAKNVNRHIFGVKISRLEHDLPKPENAIFARVLFSRNFAFASS